MHNRPFALSSLPSADGVWHTLRPLPDTLDDPQHAIEDLTLVVLNGHIAWMGAANALPTAHRDLPHFDGAGALLTPGLVDCHTHLVYGGHRANEFAMRLQGASYEAIAKAGGGIVSSVRATREANEDELFAS
jgi:imidazolonepropionase